MTEVTIQNTARKPVALAVAAAVALGGSFALGATAPASAAPLSINQMMLKEAVPGDNVIEVGRRRTGRVIAGMALGIIGAAIAHKAYRHHYRHHHRHHYRPYYHRHHRGYYHYPRHRGVHFHWHHW